MYNNITNSGQPVVHILIVWPNANNKKEDIYKDIKDSFDVIKVFKVNWDEGLFLKNLMVFYAHSQKDLTYSALKNMMRGKIKHCGKGTFSVIVFRDNNPKFENRKTSSGIRQVNINVFDKKVLYRGWAGGGHRIHCSDDAWETNKDLTIMFGLNTIDFCSKYDSVSNTDSLTEEYINHNCIGVKGYDSLEMFFYVLNNTIDYVVLWKDSIQLNNKDKSTIINMLVEHKNYIRFLTGAKRKGVFKNKSLFTVKVENSCICLSIRYLGDNYIDSSWEADLLKSKEVKDGMYYVPNLENQFYVLLYHAYVHNKEVQPENIQLLRKYATTVGINYNPDVKESIKSLDCFFEKNNYEYIKPSDNTVLYNVNNLSISNWAFRFGDCVKRIDEHDCDFRPYHSILFKKKDSYVKKGVSWLIDNEAYYLSQMSDTHIVPSLLKHERIPGTSESVIEISKVPGYDMQKMYYKSVFYTESNIRFFMKKSIECLLTLKEKNIAHRDFQLPNIMLNIIKGDRSFYILDFGWSTSLNKINIDRPSTLTSRYAKTDNDTDFVVFSRVISSHWGKMPYIMRIAGILEKLSQDTISNEISYNEMKRCIDNGLNYHFCTKDYLFLFIYKLRIFQFLKMLYRWM